MFNVPHEMQQILLAMQGEYLCPQDATLLCAELNRHCPSTLSQNYFDWLLNQLLNKHCRWRDLSALSTDFVPSVLEQFDLLYKAGMVPKIDTKTGIASIVKIVDNLKYFRSKTLDCNVENWMQLPHALVLLSNSNFLILELKSEAGASFWSRLNSRENSWCTGNERLKVFDTYNAYKASPLIVIIDYFGKVAGDGKWAKYQVNATSEQFVDGFNCSVALANRLNFDLLNALYSTFILIRNKPMRLLKHLQYLFPDVKDFYVLRSLLPNESGVFNERATTRKLNLLVKRLPTLDGAVAETVKRIGIFEYIYGVLALSKNSMLCILLSYVDKMDKILLRQVFVESPTTWFYLPTNREQVFLLYSLGFRANMLGPHLIRNLQQHLQSDFFLSKALLFLCLFELQDGNTNILLFCHKHNLLRSLFLCGTRKDVDAVIHAFNNLSSKQKCPKLVSVLEAIVRSLGRKRKIAQFGVPFSLDEKEKFHLFYWLLLFGTKNEDCKIDKTALFSKINSVSENCYQAIVHCLVRENVECFHALEILNNLCRFRPVANILPKAQKLISRLSEPNVFANQDNLPKLVLDYLFFGLFDEIIAASLDKYLSDTVQYAEFEAMIHVMCFWFVSDHNNAIANSELLNRLLLEPKSLSARETKRAKHLHNIVKNIDRIVPSMSRSTLSKTLLRWIPYQHLASEDSDKFANIHPSTAETAIMNTVLDKTTLENALFVAGNIAEDSPFILNGEVVNDWKRENTTALPILVKGKSMQALLSAVHMNCFLLNDNVNDKNLIGNSELKNGLFDRILERVTSTLIDGYYMLSHPIYMEFNLSEQLCLVISSVNVRWLWTLAVDTGRIASLSNILVPFDIILSKEQVSGDLFSRIFDDLGDVQTMCAFLSWCKIVDIRSVPISALITVVVAALDDLFAFVKKNKISHPYLGDDSGSEKTLLKDVFVLLGCHPHFSPTIKVPKALSFDPNKVLRSMT